MDEAITLLVVILIAFASCVGYRVGRESEAYRRDSAACVEQCKPMEAVFSSDKCGCMP